ncbi:MAG: DUF1016 N-terminal domain-containing protein [Eubacteriales bacterium]|nr:DUF1016 N-terminal domain-containing protein [Eubacteriales bacterium]
MQTTIKTLYEQGYNKSQIDKAEPSNTELMRLYAFIGRSICTQGEKAFVVFLADLLGKQFPDCKGFSPRNLRRMRDYYQAYENTPDLMYETEILGWTQNVVILESCECNGQRAFYIDLALKQNLSKLALLKTIEADTFEQTIHDAEEIRNAYPVVMVENNIVTDGNIGLSERAGIVCRSLMPACLTFLQGNSKLLSRQAVPGFAEENALGLWSLLQLVYHTSFINHNRSFMLRWNMTWLDCYQRWMAERITDTVVISTQNTVVWETVKVAEPDRSSEVVQNGDETCKFFGDLCVLTYHVFLIKCIYEFLTILKNVEISVDARHMKWSDESSTHLKNRTDVRITSP